MTLCSDFVLKISDLQIPTLGIDVHYFAHQTNKREFVSLIGEVGLPYQAERFYHILDHPNIFASLVPAWFVIEMAEIHNIPNVSSATGEGRRSLCEGDRGLCVRTHIRIAIVANETLVN